MAHKDENGNWKPEGNCWTRDEVNFILQQSPLAVEHGIVHLYKLQTQDEKTSQNNNGYGFSQSAARGGTFYAQCIINSTNRPSTRLWGRGLEKARNICIQHLRQLTEIANEQMTIGV